MDIVGRTVELSSERVSQVGSSLESRGGSETVLASSLVELCCVAVRLVEPCIHELSNTGIDNFILRLQVFVIVRDVTSGVHSMPNLEYFSIEVST